MASTVTFYSYKGGVGRSLALANVACLLASKGRRVFLLDLDLEAPGLDSFFIGTSGGNLDGFVEYVASYKASQQIPQLDRYVSELSVPNLSGKLFLMPAGKKDNSYQIELHKLNWKDFYRREDGFFLIENLKGQIIERYKPDYILIDSRTGLTDIGGICTLQLPDVVVLMFGLNEQNLNGTRHVLNSIQFNNLGRDIKTTLVASPVPEVPAGDSLLEARMQRARELTGGQPIDVVVRYNPTLAFKESLLSMEAPDSTIVADYRKIVAKIVGFNPADFEARLKTAQEKIMSGNTELAISEFSNISVAFPENYSVQLQCSIFFRFVGNYKMALACAERALSIRPDALPAVAEFARALLTSGARTKAKNLLLRLPEDFRGQGNLLTALEMARLHERLGLMDRALRWYQEASIGKSGEVLPHALDYANFLIQLGDYKGALKVLGAILAKNPNDLAATFNAGATLLRMKRTSEAKVRFQRAIELFESSNLPEVPAFRANAYQAMHIAYETLGQRDRAVSCLKEARKWCEELADSKEEILSPFTYRLVSMRTFHAENTKALLRLSGRTTTVKRQRKKSRP